MRAAIIRAARTRFAREGLTASLRDIASDAKVNLGLVHRHFGSKDALIRAVFAESAEHGRVQIASASSFEDAIQRLVDSAVSGDSAYGRMLTLMLLAGADPRDLQTGHPTIERLIEMGGPERRPLVLLAVLLSFGWPIYKDFLSTAAGYGSDDEAFSDLAAMLSRFAADDRPAESVTSS